MFDNPELFKKFGKEYHAGEIIFCEYEKGETLYYIISGKVKISKITVDKEKIIAYLGAGEFIGEMAIFENKPRTATVITKEKTKMLLLKKDDFFKLMHTAPELVVQLMKSLSIRKLNTSNQLNNLLKEDKEEKIARYITAKLDGNSNREMSLKINEIAGILDFKEEEIMEYFYSYQKKGYLKILDDEIRLKETGWLAFKIKN